MMAQDWTRHKMIERVQIIGPVAEPEKLPDAEFYQWIFEPGFTTAGQVTDMSGRGVGMDVVRRNIEALRGSVSIDSDEHRAAPSPSVCP